jgi:hypothetical protein
MNKMLVPFLITVFLFSCKSKQLDSTKAYFSVIGYLNSEVKKMDSMPLHFTKVTSEQNTNDTSEITKKEFHKYVNEFLSLPDIATPDKMDDYSEANDFDEVLNNVLLMYTAKQDDEVVKNQTIMMQPDDIGNTHVKTILVTTEQSNKDSTVVKNLTWHIDKRFQIVTKINNAGQPEKITTTVISWQ